MGHGTLTPGYEIVFKDVEFYLFGRKKLMLVVNTWKYQLNIVRLNSMHNSSSCIKTLDRSWTAFSTAVQSGNEE